MVHEWLTQYTGNDGHFWMQRIQTRIAKHTEPTDDPHHGKTATAAAFHEVMTEIMLALDTRFPVTGEPYDENMRMAACVSVLTTLWYSRIQLAKVSDPNRPVQIRQQAYRRWLAYQHALVHAQLDMSDDASYFPDQQWESPFVFDAIGGDFV